MTDESIIKDDGIDDFVFVDIETTGLDVHRHNILEVAYAIGDGPITTLYPEFQYDTFETAQIEAMDVNRFFDRFPAQSDDAPRFVVDEALNDVDGVEFDSWTKRWEIALSLPLESTEGEWETFVRAIKGKTLVGANVRFDENFLKHYLTDYDLEHSHRLWDLGSYAAGKFAKKKPIGFSDVARRAGITPGNHEALDDVRVTREVFKFLTSEG